MKTDKSKFILLILVLIFAVFLQLVTNEIPDTYMTIIAGFISALIGISINPDRYNSDKE